MACALALFDVNETLADLDAVDRRFAEAGGGGELAAAWLTATLRDGIALSAAGASAPFAELGHAAAKEILARLDDPPDDLEGAADHVLEGLAEVTLVPDAPEALRILLGAGVRVATLTNGSAATAKGLFDRGGVGGLAEAHLAALDFGRWKPARQAYLGACWALGVEPAAATLIAVHPWDVDGAQRAGLTGAWVDTGSRPYPGGMLAPTVRGASLVEVARALVARRGLSV